MNNTPKLLGLLFVSFFVSSSAFAYTPTNEDRDWIDTIEEKVDTLYPQHASHLVKAYESLENKKLQVFLSGGDRGLYLLEELQSLLADALFSNSNVCINSYAQPGDTAEILYAVYGTDKQLVRITDTAFAFNVGSDKVWKSLSVHTQGMKVGNTKYTAISTAGVGAMPGELEQKSFDLSPSSQVYIGQEYVFGTPKSNVAILGKVVSFDDDTVTFDFTDASTGEHVALELTLQSLVKSCR